MLSGRLCEVVFESSARSSGLTADPADEARDLGFLSPHSDFAETHRLRVRRHSGWSRRSFDCNLFWYEAIVPRCELQTADSLSYLLTVMKLNMVVSGQVLKSSATQPITDPSIIRSSDASQASFTSFRPSTGATWYERHVKPVWCCLRLPA